MHQMFTRTGLSSPFFKLNCSNWNVSKVTNYNYFNAEVESKVTSPTWGN